MTGLTIMPNATMPTTAMVFAAGLGTRMRSYRSDIPKPLVEVAGRSLIDRVLDKLVAAGVDRAVINVSYMGEMIKAHLAPRTDIALLFSEEETPLETGGGIVKALPLLGEAPFFVINADISWEDGPTPALEHLSNHYDPSRMDALLLACPISQTTGYQGQGDFVLREDGRVRRRDESDVNAQVFTGVQMLHPRIFKRRETWPEAFSLNQFFVAESEKEPWIEAIYAISHDRRWFHVGDGEGVRAAEACLAA